MKKTLTVGLYDPYLDVLGGGEKHILSILKVFADQGHDIRIFWDKNLTHAIAERFSLNFNRQLTFLPNIFNKRNFFLSTLQTLTTLRTFDYFFYVTNGSYFFSTAKCNFIFCMVPDKKLCPISLIDKIKTWNYQFITNSLFTQSWLNQWGISPKVIYPYIDDSLLKLNKLKLKKDKIILSVGRFFPHLHSKNHQLIIETFKKLKQSNPTFKDFKLILAGSLKKEDEPYLTKLKKIVKNDNAILIKTNISLDRLYELYKLSAFFWHFSGYGVDANKFPQLVEHLGIAPLEAMAAGCITFCYNQGGPREIISNGQTGFLFDDQSQLISTMNQIINNQNQQQAIIDKANQYVNKYFSYNVFKKNVNRILKLD